MYRKKRYIQGSVLSVVPGIHYGSWNVSLVEIYCCIFTMILLLLQVIEYLNCLNNSSLIFEIIFISLGLNAFKVTSNSETQ